MHTPARANKTQERKTPVNDEKKPNPIREAVGDINSRRESDATEKLRELVAICKSRIERSSVAATREYRRAYAKGSPVVFATRMNDRTNGFAYKDELRPIYRHLVASVGAILNGVPFEQLERVCGLSNEELRQLANLDPSGYGLLYRGACNERRRNEEQQTDTDKCTFSQA